MGFVSLPSLVRYLGHVSSAFPVVGAFSSVIAHPAPSPRAPGLWDACAGFSPSGPPSIVPHGEHGQPCACESPRLPWASNVSVRARLALGVSDDALTNLAARPGQFIFDFK